MIHTLKSVVHRWREYVFQWRSNERNKFLLETFNFSLAEHGIYSLAQSTHRNSTTYFSVDFYDCGERENYTTITLQLYMFFDNFKWRNKNK